MARWLIENLPAAVLIDLLHHQEAVIAFDDDRGSHVKIVLHQLRIRVGDDTFGGYDRRFLVEVVEAKEKREGISTERYSPGIKDSSLNSPT
jgi:hypothetical protein